MPAEPRSLEDTFGAQRPRPDVQAERRLIQAAERDLREEFPSLSTDEVSWVIERVWAEFQGARIRAYLPVLVHKQARNELRDRFGIDAVSRSRAPRPLVRPADPNTALGDAATPEPDLEAPRPRNGAARSFSRWAREAWHRATAGPPTLEPGPEVQEVREE